MARKQLGRRRFLTAAGTLALTESSRATDAGQDAAAPAEAAAARAGRVVQVQLPDEGFACSRQEGGKTVMAGTFIPETTQVVIDIDIAATFGGWGGGYFDFHTGVLPSSPPEQPEPGGLNRLTILNNESRTPLPGVTEYRHFPVGILSANVIASRAGRTLVLDGLAVDREYQWEMRCGGLSFFKRCNLADDAQPTALAVTPDNLYAWAACEGNNRLALVQLGWADLWPLFGYSQEMLCIAEVPLEGKPGGSAIQKGGRHIATVDRTHNKLSVVDGDGLQLVGSYALPSGATLSSESLLSSADGSKLYVGADDGKLHRFDWGRREFDQATVIDGHSPSAIVPFALSGDGSQLFCSSYQSGNIFRVDLRAVTAVPSLVYTMPERSAGPTCGAVRKRDGSLVVPDATRSLMLHVSATGTLLRTWSIAVPGQTSPPAHSSVHLDADEVRAFWTFGGGFGWAWVDSGKVINSIHAGPATKSWFTDTVCGDIAVTADEGTLLALPSSHKIIQWPGGTIRIRPSKDDPTVYGAEHAHVTFTGAKVTVG